MTALIPAAHEGGPLDVADGVARLMGDAALFARVLRRFRDDYAGGAAAIGVAIDSGDTARAHRLTHTLAGAAGMIGAGAVHQHAQALERSLGDGNGVAAALEALSTALAALLPAIDALLPEEAAPAAVSAAPNRALVAELARLLENDDGAAIDLLESARAPLAATLGAAHLRALDGAARDFDFDRALAVLRESERDGAGAG